MMRPKRLILTESSATPAQLRGSPCPWLQSFAIVRNITTFGVPHGKGCFRSGRKSQILKLLRAVQEGQSYVVTSHGKAVARIPLFETNGSVTQGARTALLKRLRSEPVVKIGR